MKRNIYSFLMAAALCGAVSCSDKISTETPEGAGYITVTSQVGAQTKAGYETKTLPADFVMEVNQGAATEYDYYVLMQKDVASNIYNESTGKTLAWASTDHSKVQVKAMTIPTVTSFDANKVLNISIEKNQTTNDNFIKNDILGASTNNGVSIVKDNIVVSFRHLMSKLHVIYEVADGISVESIQLKNVAVQGAYSFADMTYQEISNPAKGNISMFLNAGTQYGIFAAEAIFCPYTPASTSKPTLDVKLAGVSSAKSCEISFPANFSFEGGKRYVMKISIDANGNVTKSNISAENDWVKNVPGGKILWIGTSIPAGGGTVYSYPQMVANATGLNVINNAVGGSLVLKRYDRLTTMASHTKEDWDNYTEPNYSWHLSYGGLVQSFEEIESYRSLLGKVKSSDESAVDNDWVTKHINKIKELSYESLIIPYIDGTIDNCETIILDHGFNDLGQILPEAGAFNGWDTAPSEYSDVYFDALLNQKSLENIGVPNYQHYKDHLKLLFWDKTDQVLTEDFSYLIAMETIIKACREVNPNINIIIGNYFTENNKWIHYWYGLTTETDLSRSYARVLCNYNRAVASLFDCLGLVDVNKYLDITNENLWSGSFEIKADGSVGAVNDPTKFCPDGVHPSSDGTGKSNKAIADVYIQELAKIFSSTTTKSSSNSYDYGWEDVEIL